MSTYTQLDVELTRRAAGNCPKCGSDKVGFHDFIMVPDAEGNEDEMQIGLECTNCGYDEDDNPDVPFVGPTDDELPFLMKWGLDTSEVGL